MHLVELAMLNLSAGEAGEAAQLSMESNNNVFTRANVFGMFLTLTICILVQPVGSLIFGQPQNVIGRVAFFFWRLHPLACVSEALLIASVVIAEVGIYLNAYINGRYMEDYTDIWQYLRVTLIALQSLREQEHILGNRCVSTGGQGESEPSGIDSVLSAVDASGQLTEVPSSATLFDSSITNIPLRDVSSPTSIPIELATLHDTHLGSNMGLSRESLILPMIP